MGYQAERDQFIATVSREGMPLTAASQLLRIATTINRLAELACSSEAADRDRIPCPASPLDLRGRARRPSGPCICDGHNDTHEDIARIRLQDWQAEQRAKRIVAALGAGWAVLTSGDPRGYTLRVVPPSYAARNEGQSIHNLRAIGVPARPSGIRW
jgi:hypothetical protein